jgi:hypothetical protein
MSKDFFSRVQPLYTIKQLLQTLFTKKLTGSPSDCRGDHCASNSFMVELFPGTNFYEIFKKVSKIEQNVPPTIGILVQERLRVLPFRVSNTSIEREVLLDVRSCLP